MKLTMLGVVAATCIENDLAEHMDVPIDTRKMPNHELQFHYLERHDFDNQLDGCEVIKALIHWHEQGNKDSHDGGCGFIATQSTISKTADHNSKRYTSTTIRVWLFALVMLVLTQMLPETDALPAASYDRHSGPKLISEPRQPRTGCRKRLIRRTNKNMSFCYSTTGKAMFPEDAVPWHNPCSATAYNDSAHVDKSNLTLKPIQRNLKVLLATKYGTCSNSDGSKTYWCDKRSNYTFFEHSGKTDKLCLRLEQKRLQVYVGGLSFLNRTNENDRRHNLNDILQGAKNLLCEIETYINLTAQISKGQCAKAPKPLSPREMCLRLDLRSMQNEDDTEVDVIFAKANFGKYLRGLNRTLASHHHPQTCGRSRPGRRSPPSFTQLSSSARSYSDETNTVNGSSQLKKNRRKNQSRRLPGKLPSDGSKPAHPRRRLVKKD